MKIDSNISWLKHNNILCEQDEQSCFSHFYCGCKIYYSNNILCLFIGVHHLKFLGHL